MIRIRQIKVPVASTIDLKKYVSNKLHIKESSILSLDIIKRSIDARDKTNILYVYEVNIKTNNDKYILKHNRSKDIFLSPNLEYKYKVVGDTKLRLRPIIVGSGPCGLFAAYHLARVGFKPLILERGEKVEDRVKTVEEFFKTNKLNINSNIQFGEGGAGTFSDGKLNTLVKDKENRGREVLKIFVECGAPPEITYDAHPHIGTDILRKVIINMREKIISMGGEFRYSSCVTDLVIENGKCHGVIVNGKEKIESEVVVLALGHSARDTFYMLNSKNIPMHAKPFAVGIRIEHPRSMIDTSQYGEFSNILGSASYKLTHKCSNGRGVYTFCMCPGGYVVNASSEEERLAINGMSNYKRDSKNSNSAVVVTITPSDFGSSPMDGIEYQRNLEEKAYIEGKGLIPVQLYKDFKSNIKSTAIYDITPTTKGNYNLSNINNILPKYIVDSLIEGIDAFSTKIKDFNRGDAIIEGVESRTSSPVVIERDANGLSIPGLYPAGEGAGYSGGITTSAIDGIKVFENIIKKYYI